MYVTGHSYVKLAKAIGGLVKEDPFPDDDKSIIHVISYGI